MEVIERPAVSLGGPKVLTKTSCCVPSSSITVQRLKQACAEEARAHRDMTAWTIKRYGMTK